MRMLLYLKLLFTLHLLLPRPVSPAAEPLTSAIGKPKMAFLLPIMTRLVPFGFQMTRFTSTVAGPVVENSFRGRSITQAPFGDHMKTLVYPVPM